MHVSLITASTRLSITDLRYFVAHTRWYKSTDTLCLLWMYSLFTFHSLYLAHRRGIAPRNQTRLRLKQREFTHTDYAAATWAQDRKVIIKAEHQEAGPNTRFVVTNDESRSDEEGYDFYAQRGSSEQWIGELKNGFKGDRLSCIRYVANQFRLLIYAFAYQLVNLFQQSILQNTPLHVASIDTLRKTIIKIGAQIKQSVRRIWFHMASGCPYQDLFLTIHQKIIAYA